MTQEDQGVTLKRFLYEIKKQQKNKKTKKHYVSGVKCFLYTILVNINVKYVLTKVCTVYIHLIHISQQAPGT